MRKPRRTYFLSLGAPLSVAAEILKEAAVNWLPGNFPFLWIAGLFAAYTTGLLVQDVYNRDSWIRDNWRRWRRPCIFGALIRKIEKFDPSYDGSGGLREYVRLTLPFRMTRDAKDFSIRVTAHGKHLDNGVWKKQRYEWYPVRNAEMHRGSRSEIILATLPAREYTMAFYGESRNPENYVSKFSRHLFVVDAFCQSLHVSERIILDLPSDQAGIRYKNGQRGGEGNFFAAKETERLFHVPR